MKKLITGLCVVVLTIGAAAIAQDKKASVEFDVQNYKIEADLAPAEQKLRGRAEVTFVPQSETRSVVFEMNGSLTITKVTLKAGAIPKVTTPPPTTPVPTTRPGIKKPAPATPTATTSTTTGTQGGLQFIQDSRESMNVRVDLGSVVVAKQALTLIFEYEGVLETAQGGPIQNARLAYVGNQGSYLFYAARWFPFHEYAADRATYQITITVPKGIIVAGYSEQPTTGIPTGNKTAYTFTSTKPILPGN